MNVYLLNEIMVSFLYYNIFLAIRLYNNYIFKIASSNRFNNPVLSLYKVLSCKTIDPSIEKAYIWYNLFLIWFSFAWYKLNFISWLKLKQSSWSNTAKEFFSNQAKTIRGKNLIEGTFKYGTLFRKKNSKNHGKFLKYHNLHSFLLSA